MGNKESRDASRYEINEPIAHAAEEDGTPKELIIAEEGKAS